MPSAGSTSATSTPTWSATSIPPASSIRPPAPASRATRATAARPRRPSSPARRGSSSAPTGSSTSARSRTTSSAGCTPTAPSTRSPAPASAATAATAARPRSRQLDSPYDIAFAPNGDLYLADTGNNVIRRIDTSGVISTVAGNGEPIFAGDGGPAATCSLRRPSALLFDAAGLPLDRRHLEPPHPPHRAAARSGFTTEDHEGTEGRTGPLRFSVVLRGERKTRLDRKCSGRANQGTGGQGR